MTGDVKGTGTFSSKGDLFVRVQDSCPNGPDEISYSRRVHLDYEYEVALAVHPPTGADIETDDRLRIVHVLLRVVLVYQPVSIRITYRIRHHTAGEGVFANRCNPEPAIRQAPRYCAPGRKMHQHPPGRPNRSLNFVRQVPEEIQVALAPDRRGCGTDCGLKPA